MLIAVDKTIPIDEAWAKSCRDFLIGELDKYHPGLRQDREPVFFQSKP